MIERFALRILLLVLSGNLLLPLYAVQTGAPQSEPSKPDVAAEVPATTNAVFHPLKPGPVDGQISYVTARLLERYHYLRMPFDTAVSTKFFDKYLDMFDPQHVHFLQSDLAEFDHYRTNLDRLTLGHSDARPADEIFNRFVERLGQRVAYVDELLKTEKFTFNNDERILINRKDQPYPKDLNDAKKIWRERLRFEYLQEELGRADAKDKATAASTSSTPKTAELNKPKKTEAEEIVETLSHRYHRNLHTFIDWDHDDVLQVYLTTLAHVYDPHSDYFGGSQLDSFAIGMNLSLFGIGAELMSEDGYCTIHHLLPGGPAEKSKKIKENDRIIAVAQSNQPPVDVVDMSLNKAVQLIRGPKGTEVRLTILPAGTRTAAPKTISLVRDEIKLEDQEAKAKLIEMPNGHGGEARLGVIDLPSFYASFDPSNNRGKTEPKSTTADVARLLTKLKQENANGVILDLRRNGGGSLEEAIRLTGLFIKEGPVVQVRNPDGNVEEDDDTDPTELYEGPLIVLTSRLSASASEILAGALQDYGRALIVGDSSTHGKGTVQSVQPLRPYMRINSSLLTNNPGALKLTIKKFYRPSGASTQLKGVVSDIILPSLFNESKDIGETALDNPLPWDTIDSAKYDHFNMVQPYLPELRRRSSERVAKDKEFSYIREDIALFKKQQADKTISLNEKVRLKEKEDAIAREKARDKERLARIEPKETIYELSLKQALLPGLPPPLGKTNSTLASLSATGPAIHGLNTNSAIAAIAATSTAPITRDDTSASTPLDGAIDEEKAPPVDADLEESEHILVDYLSLMSKSGVVAAGHTP
ncbi:MAG TPA: carboxy terminal-processing peptidase [Verrucomicrobiae bacterium]|nr:carboxy terminal-processing peptidase [Verrucomicrobiae bacterium]